jgi:hypothetical protein
VSQSNSSPSISSTAQPTAGELKNLDESEESDHIEADDFARAKQIVSSHGSLSQLGDAQLRCIRNEPYARRGYIFKDKGLTQFFSSQSWYKPTTSDVASIASKLTSSEKNLIKEVQQEEKRRHAKP